ncbi:MAG: hypothetical protein J1F36_01885 [Clostridiales bacterium]|nr:hypothetical protein [Clostridiales bacterium]
MKKISFFVLFVLVLSVLALSACSGALGKYEKSVSEYRDNVYVGSSSGFTAEAVSGYREAPFEIDGKSGSKADFCLVTITPASYDPTKEYTYSVTLNGVEYTGDFVKHPFENTYSFEVAARCVDNTLTVTVDGENIELASVKTEQYITPEKAFEIALKRLGSTQIVKNGKYEIYIRLIANPINAAGGYFWYVAFVDESQETVAVLIHPENMEITAVRE